MSEYLILQRRPLSARLVFFTAQRRHQQEAGAGVSAEQATTTELVVKEGAYEGEGGVAHVRKDVRAGDVVRVIGEAESAGAEAGGAPDAAAAAVDDGGAADGGRRPPQQGNSSGGNAVVVRQLEVVQRWRDAGGKDGRTFNWSGQPRAGGIAAVAAAAGGPGAGGAAAAAAAAGGRSPSSAPVCKYFVNTGRCARGAACPYAHDASAAQRLAWVGERAAARRRRGGARRPGGGGEGEGEEEGGHQEEDGTAAAKAQRARIFAAWVGAAFFGGADDGDAPDSVVDVAGGRGALTFELAALRRGGDGGDGVGGGGGGGGGGSSVPPLLLGRANVTLVDPRPLRLNRKQALRLRLQERDEGGGRRKDAAAAAAAGGGGGGGAAGAGRWRVEDVLTGGVISESRQAAADSAPPAVFRQARAEFGAELWRSEAWRRAVEGKGGEEGQQQQQQQQRRRRPVVVALHPDQATDAALDYALERGLPFAIVPCCVFPALFPGRRLRTGDGGEGEEGGGSGGKGGAPVRSYEELVAYLIQRGGESACSAMLPFVGRNVVVYGCGGGRGRQVDVMAADRAAAAAAARPPAEFAPRGEAGGEEEEDQEEEDREEEDEEQEEDWGAEDERVGQEEDGDGGMFDAAALLKPSRR